MLDFYTSDNRETTKRARFISSDDEIPYKNLKRTKEAHHKENKELPAGSMISQEILENLRQHFSREMKKQIEVGFQALKEELMPILENLKKKTKKMDYPSELVRFLLSFELV